MFEDPYLTADVENMTIDEIAQGVECADNLILAICAKAVLKSGEKAIYDIEYTANRQFVLLYEREEAEKIWRAIYGSRLKGDFDHSYEFRDFYKAQQDALDIFISCCAMGERVDILRPSLQKLVDHAISSAEKLIELGIVKEAEVSLPIERSDKLRDAIHKIRG